MTSYVLKAQDALQEVVLDWRAGYLAPLEIIVDDLGWNIRNATFRPGDLSVSEQSHDFQKSRAVFFGGHAARFYLLSNRVRTSRDRTLERLLVMRIASG
ncbi:MAG: hypothetical protein KDK03_17190 [Rhodobacteraceae bacterium]|nr:hypothetical protein [Paracoccaceae bacterium]